MCVVPHALGQAFIDPCNLDGSSRHLAEHSSIDTICAVPHSRVPLHIITPSPSLYSSIQNCSLSQIAFRCQESFGVLPHCDHVNIKICFEAVIEQVWRCTWRPSSSALRDAIGGPDLASLETHMEAMNEWTQRYTWRTSSSELKDALRSHDRLGFEEYLISCDLEMVDQ